MRVISHVMIVSAVFGLCGYGFVKPKLNHEAIFLDAPAFVQNKPQITAEANGGALNIKSHELFDHSEISFRFRNENRKLLKTGMYGYRDRQGFNYRFYAGKIFKIEDTSGYYQYVREPLRSSKRLTQVSGKRYFSQLPDGEITETNPKQIK